MGWNEGYTIFEATVIGAYDLGKLDKALLTVLMEPYRDTDIDSGGSRDLTARDGKKVEQIVIETWGLAMPAAPPGDYDEDSEAWLRYDAVLYDTFREVTSQFNWR